jgi:hypothetical protein
MTDISAEEVARPWKKDGDWWDGGLCPYYQRVQPDSPGHMLRESGYDCDCSCGLTFAEAVRQGYLEATGQTERREAQAARDAKCDELDAELERLKGKAETVVGRDSKASFKWDSDKYYGIVQWETLDERIAQARTALASEKHDDSRPLLEQRVHEGRNCRVYQPRVLGGKL